MAKNMLRELFRIKLLIAILGALVTVDGLDSFINLDCGLPNGASYVDGLGYNYTSGDQYVESGEINNVTSEFLSSPTMFQTFGSFPSYQRNCHSLVPVTKGKRYLVRASFMYGNYDLQNLLPNFDIYLGVDKWHTVKLDNSSDVLWTEIITTANDTSISVCLVRTAGASPSYPLWRFGLLMVNFFRVSAGWCCICQ